MAHSTTLVETGGYFGVSAGRAAAVETFGYFDELAAGAPQIVSMFVADVCSVVVVESGSLCYVVTSGIEQVCRIALIGTGSLCRIISSGTKSICRIIARIF